MKDESSGNYNVIFKRKIKASVKRALTKDFNKYSSPKGLKELRESIAKWLTSNWEYQINPSNLLITSGSMQSIYLLLEILLRDEYLVIEDQTFYLVNNLINLKNYNCKSVPISEDGIDLKRLETILKNNNVKVIYVIPTFNNPTGYTWSLKVRLKFLELINKYNVLVIEDDPYSLINYSDTTFESLYKLNRGHNIIYLGTFSKYISPSINVGFVLASKDIIDKLYCYKEVNDIGTNYLNQLVILDYLNHYDLNKDIKRKVKIYKRLLKKSQKEIRQKYKNAQLSNIQGGLFYTIKVNKEIKRINICAKLKRDTSSSS